MATYQGANWTLGMKPTPTWMGTGREGAGVELAGRGGVQLLMRRTKARRRMVRKEGRCFMVVRRGSREGRRGEQEARRKEAGVR